jgi:Flp pilus assembly protein TadG
MKSFLQFVATLQHKSGCREGLRGVSGSATLEVSFTIGFLLIPMLLGTADLGWTIYNYIEVSNAAHAGAMYGMTSSAMANNTSAIVAAAQADASDIGTNLSVTPTIFYACSASEGGTQYSTQTGANNACSGSGNHPLEFLRVAVSAALTPPIRLPGLPTPFNLTGTSVIEVEE